MCLTSMNIKVEEEKTSHFVQLDDGTFAEMVEGHEMVAPGNMTFSIKTCAALKQGTKLG